MNTTEQMAAIAAAENEVRSRPQDYAAHETLGTAYFDADRYEEAMKAFQRAVELNPSDGRAYDGIGHIHYRIDSPPQAAIDAYEQGIARDPHFAGNYYGLSILYSAKLGDHEKAVEALERGLVAKPGDPFLTASLGSVYARAGQVDKGINLLERAEGLNPQDTFAPGWLGLLYLHQHRFDLAEAAIRRAIAVEDEAHLHRMLGYIYHARGQEDQAVAELERAVQLDPNDYEARAALAVAYRSTGNLPAAEHAYQAAHEMAMRDNEYGQACFYAVSEDPDKALDSLEIALAKNQSQPGWARIDPEFAFLQDNPRFQSLVK